MNGSRPPPYPATSPPPRTAISPTTSADTSTPMIRPRRGADASAPSTCPAGWSPAGGQRAVEAHYNCPNRYAQQYAPTLAGSWWWPTLHKSNPGGWRRWQGMWHWRVRALAGAWTRGWAAPGAGAAGARAGVAGGGA